MKLPQFHLDLTLNSDRIIGTAYLKVVMAPYSGDLTHLLQRLKQQFMNNHFLQRSRQKSNSTYNQASQQPWLGQQSKASYLKSESSEAIEAKTSQKIAMLENAKGTEPQVQAFSAHSSYELMQHFLKGVNCEQKNCLLSTAEEEEQLGQLLTNRYKIDNYKQQLKSRIRKGNTAESKHLKLLLVLLQQAGKAQLEVTYSQQGLSVGFNTKIISKQQQEIDRLQQQNERRKRELQEMTKEYGRILLQFNEVIEKLVPKENKPRTQY